MQKILQLLVFSLVSAVFSTPSALSAQVAKTSDALASVPNITVLADSSLTIPITRLSQQFSRNSLVSVTTTFGQPQRHAEMVEDGEAADVLITADEAIIRTLNTKGLMDVKSPREIAGNKFVFLVPYSNGKAEPGDTLQSRFKAMVAANPEFQIAALNPVLHMEGRTGITILKSLGVASPEQHLRLFDSYKEFQNAMLRQRSGGFILKTELGENPAAAGALDVPAEMYPPHHYAAVVVAGENMPTARKYLEYIASEESKSIFKLQGYEVR